MKISKFAFLIMFLFIISCGGMQVDEKNDKDDNEVKNPENNVEPKNPNVKKTDNEDKNKADEVKKPIESEPNADDKKDNVEKKEDDEFKPMYDYKIIETNNPLNLKFQTEHAYYEVQFSDEKSVLDFYEDDLKTIGKKHLIKKCIDYVETFYTRVEKWLALGNAKPAFPGVCLYLHESSNRFSIPKDVVAENFKDYLLLVIDLSEFSKDAIGRRLWYELVPIDSDIVRTGLSHVQPFYKGMEVKDYYSFISVVRMSVPTNDFFNNSTPMPDMFYDLQRADFTAFMLEQSQSVEEFLGFCKDDSKFKDLYSKWMTNRKLFFENDRAPEFYGILYQIHKEQYTEALNKLSSMLLNTVKSEEAEFLKFANISFFAGRYKFIRKLLEEQVLSIDFLFNRMPKEKTAILFDQTRMPIEFLFASVFNNDTEFTNRLVIYLDKIGYVLLSRFLLYSQNILSEIELIRVSGKKEVEDFLNKIPKNYHNDFKWWFEFICMISELKYGFVSTAKQHLSNLSEISTSDKQIQLAKYAFEHNSK